MPRLSHILPISLALATPTSALAASTAVLWYTGNNGYTSGTTTSLEAAITAQGGTFSSTSTMPDSLSDYRVVFLVSPARLFAPSVITELQSYVDGGGTLVMLGNEGGDAGSLGVLQDLADELGLASTWVSDSLDSSCGTDGAGYEGAVATSVPLTECIDSINYAGSSDMSVGTGATSLFTGESDQPLVVLEGNVLLVADRDIFLDTCTLSAGNKTFFAHVYAGLSSSAGDEDCDGYAPTSAGGLDCDDTNAEINPDASDICDDIDNNCDGNVDEDTSYGTTWYTDADDDGYGTDDETIIACEEPAGYADNTRDCDDGNASRHPDADEYCNGVDEDCDGATDDDPVDGSTWYADVDEDGYGSDADTVASCDPVDDYLSSGGDCDDTLSRVHPGATEYCNGEDDDCNGSVDDDAANPETWYQDSDNDGYGDVSVTTETCDQPDGYVANSRDCDDADATSYPGAPGWTEACKPYDTGDTGDSSGTGSQKPGGCDCATGDGGGRLVAGWWMLATLSALLVGRRRS